MVRKKIDKRIFKKLKEELRNHHPQSIRNAVSRIRQDHGVTINAAAFEYAKRNDIKVSRWLDDDDRESWRKIPQTKMSSPTPNHRISKIVSSKKKITQFIKYDTADRFITAHIRETNLAYTYGCYTAAFILCRKIIENLLTDVIRKKYPQNNRQNIEMYFDTSRNKTRDFSEILKNLQTHANDFGPDKSLLERILNKSTILKDDANKKAHSWYHIVRNSKELDDLNIQDILDMIFKLEKNS